MHQSLAATASFAGVLAFAWLAPAPAVADDAARISRLETEIQQLRTLVDGQARRIQRLEDELKRRNAAADPQPRPRSGETKTDAPASTSRQPWHGPAAWNRVTAGMGAEEVTKILGTPTGVESIGALQTFFYRGSAPGGPAVSGHVNLKDGRVVAVNKPAF